LALGLTTTSAIFSVFFGAPRGIRPLRNPAAYQAAGLSYDTNTTTLHQGEFSILRSRKVSKQPLYR
jgi:hypothetical protein